MKVAFTVATANYLGFAHTLADSVIRHNPDYTFVICLLDAHPSVDMNTFSPHKIVIIEDIQNPVIRSMAKRYNLFELMCALKPVVANFLLDLYSPDILLFFDSDILVLSNFQEAEKALVKHAALLTPHCEGSIPDDGRKPSDIDFLITGLYNAGFFAVTNSQNARTFLNWWSEKVEKYAYGNTHRWMFVDQLWLSLVPLFFPFVQAFKNCGYNVAYWNMHERTVTKREEQYFVNNVPLVFYHFGAFNINFPEILSKNQNRYDLKHFPDLQKLLNEYREEVYHHGHKKYAGLVSRYRKSKLTLLRKRLFKKIVAVLSRAC